MDTQFIYEGTDRERLISATDCKRYATHRLNMAETSYWRHLHPYVRSGMSHTGRKTIRKGEYMDLLNLIRKTSLSIQQAAEIWLNAEYWRDPEEVAARFKEEIEEIRS